MPSDAAEETRKLILETARQLLRRYGPDKMTVMDIARALDMSHANVYRFFRTKADILDALIGQWLSKIEAFVEGIAARTAPASDRIEAIVVELHRKRRKKLIEDAEFYETYRRVIEMRPDFAAKRREKILVVFRRLIESGIESGEFNPVDAQEAATVLKDATLLFLHPMMIKTALEEDTETRARAVVRYALAGFRANSVAPTAPAKRQGPKRSPNPRTAGL
jgi:AcrR family transcriptional regulator